MEVLPHRCYERPNRVLEAIRIGTRDTGVEQFRVINWSWRAASIAKVASLPYPIPRQGKRIEFSGFSESRLGSCEGALADCVAQIFDRRERESENEHGHASRRVCKCAERSGSTGFWTALAFFRGCFVERRAWPTFRWLDRVESQQAAR